MPSAKVHPAAETPPAAEQIERRIVRLYAAIVLLLWVLGGLVWGTVTAVQAAPQPVDDSLFVLLALGGMVLAGVVVYLLAQLAHWTRRRLE